MRNTAWPPEVKNQALELYKSGLSGEKVAEKLDLPQGTVGAWIRVAGIARKRYAIEPSEMKRRVLTMCADGLGNKAIHQETGVPENTIRHWVRAEWPDRQTRPTPAWHDRGKFSDEQRKRALQMIAEGTSASVIAEETGISLASARKWISQAKKDRVPRRYRICWPILPSGDMRWQKQAECRFLDAAEATRVFFPDESELAEEAKSMCSRCPVTEECLAYALRADEKYGVWGNTTERERRQMRRTSKGDEE